MVGRAKEIKILNDLYNSGKAELVVVYVRRRVGNCPHPCFIPTYNIPYF